MSGNGLPFVGNCSVYLIVFANTFQIRKEMPSKNPFNLLAMLDEIQRKAHIYGNAGTLKFA